MALNQRPLRIGLISDTHGLLRPEALEFLRGCSRIIHAGDIGEQTVLDELAVLAPVTAVRGNNDRGPWARALPLTQQLRFREVGIYVIHERSHLSVDLSEARIRVVVYGHSHRPGVEERAGVLFVNPGSAGPRRFSLPIAVGELRISGGEVSAHIATLSADRPASR